MIKTVSGPCWESGQSRLTPKASRSSLDDGTALHYDKLLVATGSRPFVPPAKGLDEVEHKTTFMSLDDANTLDQALHPDSRVLIVGAGLIGLKCAEGIAHRVGHITVVDLSERILPSILDEEGAALVQRHIEGQGIEFILGDCVRNTRRTPPCFAAAGNWILTCWSLRRACVPTLSWWPNAGAR